MPQIIAVCGKARHGKDTIADYLVQNHDYIKMAIAEPLKEACRAIFGFEESQVYGDRKEEIDEFWGSTPRKCLQYVGTELFRKQIGEILPNVGSDIWILSTCRRIKTHFEKHPDTPIVISDIRFENEWDNIKKLGFEYKLIQVFNPRINDISGITSVTHDSENLEWCEEAYDEKIINNGSLEDLYSKIDDVLVNKNDLFDICIYHQDCPDGECSSYIYKRFLDEKYPNFICEFVPMKAGDFLDINYTNKNVLLLDISFKRDKILEVSKSIKKMMILDHHKSAKDDLIDLPDNVSTIFDMERAGCQITWDHFFSHERPRFVDLVADRDLWRYEYPETKAFHAFMSINELYNYKGFQDIYNSNSTQLNEKINAGLMYLHAIESQVSIISKSYVKYIWKIEEKEYTVFLVEGPRHLTSDIGAELYKDPECDIAMIYSFDMLSGFWTVSCRTNKSEIDLSKISSKFGGGGHPKAAGFKITGMFPLNVSLGLRR